MRGRMIVALATAGCNQLFGLEVTILDPPDRDADAVADGDDNCPDVANVDQLDQDGDSFGDACDGCPDRPTDVDHDEDGDRRGDECDSCPVVPDFGNDSDGDGVANECENDPGATTQLAFDPFLVLLPAWASASTPWQVTGDSIAPVTPLAVDDPGLRHADVTVGGGGTTYVEIGVGSTDPWQDGDRFGVAIVSDTGSDLARCEVICTTTCELRHRLPGAVPVQTAVTATPLTRLRVIVRRTETSPALLCLLTPGGALYMDAGSMPVRGSPVIFGSPRLRVTHFAAWHNDPL